MAINMNNVHSAAAMCDDQEIAGILNRLEALVTDDPETEERAAETYLANIGNEP